MKILFLDDDEQRHDVFRAATIGSVVHHVRTVAEAIAALELHAPFDLADLDHDLGGEQMVEPGTQGHGLDVAQFIAAHPQSAHRVLVHSYNQPAAAVMLRVLRDAGVRAQWKPFPALVHRA